MPDEIGVDYGGESMSWSYGMWLDGNGSGPNAPRKYTTNVRYNSISNDVAERVLVNSRRRLLLLLHGSDCWLRPGRHHRHPLHLVRGQLWHFGEHLDHSRRHCKYTSNAHHSSIPNDVSERLLAIFFQTGNSAETLAAAGISGRTDLDTRIAHDDIGDLTAVTVRLEGNNGILFTECRVDFGFGGPAYAHYTWLLTTLNGWLDGDSGGSQTTVPASRTLTVASASPGILSVTDGAADFMPVIGANNAHLSVWGADVASAVASLPSQDMTVEMWTKWVAGGSDWAGPISASQDDGATEFGWNIQTRCKDATGTSVACSQSRRIEFSLATAGSGGKLAYLGYPGDASRFAGNAGLDQPVFADLTGVWSHLAYSYDGTSSKCYVDGVLAQQDDVTGSGAIIYPADNYAAGQGGWFTIGAYHDANEYYSFPGAIDELKIWHTAQAPVLGCNVPATDPNLNYCKYTSNDAHHSSIPDDVSDRFACDAQTGSSTTSTLAPSLWALRSSPPLARPHSLPAALPSLMASVLPLSPSTRRPAPARTRSPAPPS